jgi:PAS domain S-box-containing protein
MMSHPSNCVSPDDRCQILWNDGERVFCRGWRPGVDGNRNAVLIVLPAVEHPSPSSLDRLTHEYGLKDELDETWAAKPLGLVRENGQTMLVLKDAGGEPLQRLLIDPPLKVRGFLRLAIAIAMALGKLHERGLVHKDIKPVNILVNRATGGVRFTGFGIASRLSRERQAAEPPEALTGTLAYMAPEQTGRMNRSIDSRSDLYALGTTFYQMLIGALPFTAADPMEWVHCHLARQPVAPADRLKEIPGAVSAIIMKLLAKTPEDRYQTARGLERDLRRCQMEWDSRGVINFPLGELDTPDRLLIPEKLYGRRREVEALLAAFSRVVDGGAPELVLVSGYSGVGKSSIVNELHRELIEPRGLFASGKFDQYNRDIPYATLAQAFQTLIHSLLSKSEAELSRWRGALRDALGPNAKLIVNLVPKLKLIIGEPPPVPDLPLQDARRRFQSVFRRFIGVFARPEHPLALFLDDLQWLDSATLELIEDILSQSDVRHLMLIGAFRDNEVNSSHPLMRKLDAIRKAGAPVQEIVLASLTRENLAQLVTDSFRCEPEPATALAGLIHEKTGGNPFFAIQFISGLVEEGLLTFDYGDARWSWDLDRIRAQGYTDNVVDLVIGKLNRLSAQTQQTLQLLACLGNSADFNLLEIVSQHSNEELHDQLWEAIRAGLIFRTESSYKFLHDRVQEAAYSLIPENVRAETHLQLGNLLVACISPELWEEAIFEIVNQLNRGSHLITSAAERNRLAELNLIAGRRAKSSTAYISALSYLRAARALLTEESWYEDYELIFSIDYDTAECEFLTADTAAAENRLLMLAQRAKRAHDTALVTRLRVALYTALDQGDRGVEVSLGYLRGIGIDWSRHPTRDEVVREYDRIWAQLGHRKVDELINLPLMTSPDILNTLDVLSEIIAPAHYHENLLPLIFCRMVNLSLAHGNSDASSLGYLGLAVIAGSYFGNYSQAVSEFARLGYELVEKRGLKRFQARAYLIFGSIIMPWTTHVRAGRDLIRRAFDAANETGDLTWAAYSHNHLVTNLLASGDQLAEVQRQAEYGLAFERKARFGLLIDILMTQIALIRMLRGLTPKFGRLDDQDFDESRMEPHLSGNPVLACAACWYWIRKMQARYHAGDYAAAVDASSKARRLLWTSPSHFETAEFYYYGALSHAASWDFARSDEKQQHFEALKAHYKQLDIWTRNCPENFECRAALVAAEIARIESCDLDAMRLYEQAIRSAHANGFIHNEAIAYESAARFYAARGFEKIAHLYLRNARQGYQRWGADGKVRQLDQLYPHLRQDEWTAPSTRTIEAPVEHLDLTTVIKVSQAVSRDIVLDRLLETLMRIAIEQSGAERGLLILSQEAGLKIAAEARTGDTTDVQLREEPVTAAALPESVVNYVLRTRESLILDNATVQPPFAADTYVRRHQALSVLCMPLLNQGHLIGMLYLENNLTAHVFAPGRSAVLKLLAAQAAISLENGRLYRDLAEREARIRRLVDSNIVGIFIWNLEGRVIEANDAFLHMVGCDHEDLVSGRMRWTDLTPAEWRESDERALAELSATGTVQPYEKEYFRKDGSRTPVLIGAVLFEKNGNEGVAFVLDLTERNRTEESLRESEYKNRQIIETVPSLIWSTDPAGEPTQLNQRIYDYSGMRFEDFKHGGWKAFIHPDDFPETIRAFSHAIQTGTSYQTVHRLRRADGEFRWHHARGEPLRDKEGRIIQWYGLAVDINEAKKAEDRLRRGEAYLAEAQRLSHTGTSVLSGTTMLAPYLYWSDECYGIWGLDPLHGIPRPETVWQQIHPDDRARVWEEFQDALRQNKDYAGEFRIVLPDGTARSLASTAHRLFSTGGEIVEVICTYIDVTERKRAQEEHEKLAQLESDLAHMNRLGIIGEQSASLVHEITQPIAAARNNARAALNFLDHQPPKLSKIREGLSRIVGDSDRAGDIIDRIRDHVRKAPPRKTDFDLNQAIDEVIVLARSAIAKNGVAVQTRLAVGLSPVKGDRIQLQQVILNLVLNAVEAMGSVEAGPRELLISTEQTQGDGVLVTVRDCGPGINQENLERVFEAFYTTKTSGVGMGLSISRSIIGAHGGRLWADANAPRGAVFQFTLPGTETELTNQEPRQGTVSTAPHQSVCEDNR